MTQSKAHERNHDALVQDAVASGSVVQVVVTWKVALFRQAPGAEMGETPLSLSPERALQLASSLVLAATAAMPPVGLAATTRRNMLQQLLQQEAERAALTRPMTDTERAAVEASIASTAPRVSFDEYDRKRREERDELLKRHLGEPGERNILQKMSLMAALPVRSPNGRFILGYECPQCWRSHMAGTCMEYWRDVPRVDDLDNAQQRALTCCRCKRCNAWLQTSEERHRDHPGDIGFSDTPCCNACLPAALADEQKRRAELEQAGARYQDRLDASLQKALDSDAAQALCALMSELSERYYCAGWLIGLEYALWPMVHGGNREFGLGAVTEEEVAKLRRLHERAGGWWRWAEDPEPAAGGEVFVPTEEWRKLVAQSRSVP